MLFTVLLTVLAVALSTQARGGGGGRGGSGGRGGFVGYGVYSPESSTGSLLDKRDASSTTSTPLSSTSSAASTGAPASTSGVFTGGNATLFYQNNTAGACGSTHADSDLIVALDVAVYGAPTGAGPNCGRQVHVTNLLNGQNVTATVADKCPGCPNAHSLDLSTGAFDQIADESLGTVPIEWYYLSDGTDGTTAQ